MSLESGDVILFAFMVAIFAAAFGAGEALWAVFLWLRGRRKKSVVTYYPPENRFSQDQAVKAYRLTHDEWILRHLASQPIHDWKLMLLDIETSHVLAVSTGEDFEELVRTYEKEAPKHETPLEPHKIAVVPVWGSKYPTPWGRET